MAAVTGLTRNCPSSRKPAQPRLHLRDHHWQPADGVSEDDGPERERYVEALDEKQDAEGAYKIAITKAEGDYKVAVEKCEALKGKQQQACKDEADAAQKIAKAEAEAHKAAVP